MEDSTLRGPERRSALQQKPLHFFRGAQRIADQVVVFLSYPVATFNALNCDKNLDTRFRGWRVCD
jgi:hypothetical protein